MGLVQFADRLHAEIAKGIQINITDEFILPKPFCIYIESCDNQERGSFFYCHRFYLLIVSIKIVIEDEKAPRDGAKTIATKEHNGVAQVIVSQIIFEFISLCERHCDVLAVVRDGKVL